MQHATDMHELATGKDVAVDELAHAGAQAPTLLTPPAVMPWTRASPPGLSME